MSDYAQMVPNMNTAPYQSSDQVTAIRDSVSRPVDPVQEITNNDDVFRERSGYFTSSEVKAIHAKAAMAVAMGEGSDGLMPVDERDRIIVNLCLRIFHDQGMLAVRALNAR